MVCHYHQHTDDAIELKIGGSFLFTPLVRAILLISCIFVLLCVVHSFVILLIVTRGHIIQPLFVLEIPLDGLLNTLLELQRRFPPKFLLKLGGVDGITGIMAKAVSNESNQIHVFAFFTTKQTVNRVDDYFDDFDVLPLVETSDIVGFGHLALMEDEVYGTGMVFYKEPVAHVLTLALDGERLTVADIVYEERY